MSVTVKEVREKLEMSPRDFAIAIGIKTSSLYNRLRCDRQWELPELIKICEMMEQNGIGDELTVSCGGECYNITIRKKIK